MVEIDPTVISHTPNIDPNFTLVKQMKRQFDRTQPIELQEEIKRLLENEFIEVLYSKWLANPMLVKV